MRRVNTAQYAADIRAVMLQTEGLERAYWNTAPESKTFPYAVFDMRQLAQNRLTIEVDLWSLKGNEASLWSMADALEAQLDGYIIHNEHHASEITTNSDKKWVADDDERIIRINLSYSATYMA